jgi:hypothetical protein
MLFPADYKVPPGSLFRAGKVTSLLVRRRLSKGEGILKAVDIEPGDHAK